MDPTETFRMIIESALDLSTDPGNDNCQHDLCEHLYDLSVWITNGGFTPSHDDLMDILEELSYHSPEKKG